MRIGVSGASGMLGGTVLGELAKRGAGHEIVAVSRTPEGVSGDVTRRLGDYDRPETLGPAYAGLDRLLIIPTSDPRRGKRAEQNIAAIDAAARAGVGLVVLMSAAGTREQEEPALGASYWVGEQRLIKTAPKWTILRMNYYAEALAREAKMSAAMGALAGLSENRVAFVSRDDVGAAAAGILIGEGHVGAIYVATGPESLTGAERAAVIAKITGKPMGFVTIAEQAMRAGLITVGMPEDVVNIILSIQADFSAGAFDIVTGDVERLVGRPPKPLADAFKAILA